MCIYFLQVIYQRFQYGVFIVLDGSITDEFKETGKEVLVA